MAYSRLSEGEIVSWRGENHKITRIVDLEHMLAINLNSGELEKIRISEVSKVSDKKSNDKATSTIDISEVSNEQWDKAKYRLSIIQPLLDLEESCTLSDVQQVEDESEISQATLYRWLKRYKESGKLSSLIDFPRKDIGKSKLSKEQDILINCSIQNHFLKKERPTINKAYDDFKRECLKANITPCSKSSYTRRVNQLAPQAIALNRYGKKSYRQKHSDSTGKFASRFPLDVVQIDHTKPNIILVDDRDRLPIGRPWVTFAIDIYSRTILGFYLSLEAPSATSVAMCLTHAICPKNTWLRKQAIDTNWPCWGVMRVVHADNGADFRCKSVERACEEYSIEINWRPLGRPDFGGHVERLMRTVKTDLSNLQGTTFSNPLDREEYDSEGNAIFTFSELQAWLTIYITKYYHQRVHSELNTSPIAKWEEGLLYGTDAPMIGLPDIIEDERRLYLDFLPYKKRTVQRYGISLDNITYFHPSISRWIGVNAPYSDKKFFIKYELHQINFIYFLDPDTMEYLEIPRVRRDAPNMTRFELKKLHAHLKKKGLESIDENILIEAQIELENIEKKAASETKASRRLRQRKIQAPIAIAHVTKNIPDSKPDDDWDDDVQPFEDIDLEA